jgi:hypothetical protein
MIEAKHLNEYVINPVLDGLGCLSDRSSDNAHRMLLGTASKESQCGRWLHQLGAGPAAGIFQMEPITHDDLWNNFLVYKPAIAARVLRWSISRKDGAKEMEGNLYYAAAMCRIYYLRVSEVIPDTLLGQATYWKKYYNTPLGAGTVQEYIDAWKTFVIPDVFEVRKSWA